MDVGNLMGAPVSSEQEAFGQKAEGHGALMAQVLMGLGRVEAKIDMMMAEDKAEDESESDPEDMASSIIKAVESGMPSY